MPSDSEKVFLPYDEARQHILDADVLLYRRRGFIPKCVAIAGLSIYSHVGMAGWTNGDPDSEYNRLMAYEMLWRGGQSTTLAAHVEKWPGMIDVYRCADTHTEYWWDDGTQSQQGETKVLDRKKAVMTARDFCRPGEYGKMHILWTSLIHLPGVRFFFRPPTDDDLEDRGRPPYCSEAVSCALRRAFTDVVRNMPDHYTSPGALARSPLLHYMFTLGVPS